ncbi:hypothetical protein ACTHQ8_19445 [Lysinibacillus odysseyi]
MNQLNNIQTLMEVPLSAAPLFLFAEQKHLELWTIAEQKPGS